MVDAHTTRSQVLTLVFTDLADSTALKTQRGDAAIASLIARHAAHIKRLAADCGGRIIDWAGDGCFLTFETSSSAVLFALRLQQAHAEEADLPGVRIGIHMGEVTVSTNENGAPRVAGLAVDLAARISGLARPGQVLMSAAVYDSARQRIGVESLGQPILWQAHGTYTLKGFDKELEIGEAGMKDIAPLTAPASGDKAKLVRRPPNRKRRLVALGLGATLAVTLLAAAYFLGGSRIRSVNPAPGTGPIASLAVLPLENLSGDPEQSYFADGMTEALTSELSKIQSIKVIPRTSVMKYKGTTLSAREVAAELGVEGLIQGSVQKYDDQVKITAQLIHGPSNTNRWSESYTNSMTNVLTLQSDVALAIAGAMKAELTGDEQTRIAKSQTVDPKAYDAYLRGMHFHEQVTPEGLRTAIRYFEEATRLDPRFADAWAMQAVAYTSLSLFGMAPPEETFPKAREFYMKALDIDSDLAQAHMGLGAIAFLYDREWEQAEQRYRHALELDLRVPRGNIDYGLYLLATGRRSEAVEQAELVLELDSGDPWLQQSCGMILGIAGESGRALVVVERLLESRPDFLPAYTLLGNTHLELGNYEKAITFFEQGVLVSARSPTHLLWLARALAIVEQPDRARAVLAEALGKGGYFDAGLAAMVYALLGELEPAFEWMDKSIASRDQGVMFLRLQPYMKSLLDNPNIVKFRTDPRFWKIMERTNIPPLPPGHPGYAEEQAWLAKKKAAADANAPITKIAVLPFKNISGDAQQEFFVDGMTEALISELAKIKSIKVISRTSAMHYKDTTKTLPEIAKELGVDGLVEGSAMKADNQVRITAQLIRATTDNHLWAESYTETLENVLKVQSQVALAIAEKIKAVVTPDERSRLASARTVNIDAYELYVQARRYWSLRTPDGFRRAHELFTQSLEIDPNFALGHAGLADTYYTQAEYAMLPSDEACRLAREEAEKALSLDSDVGEAYATLGVVTLAQTWDWAASEKLFLKAIELSPNYATAHHWYALHLCGRGHRAEAVEELRIANQLDPNSPVIGAIFAEFLGVYGRRQESFEVVERFARQYPGNWRVQTALAVLNLRAGQYDEALAAAERMTNAPGDQASSGYYMALVLAKLGRADESRKLIEETIAGTEVSKRQPVFIALAYAVLGDRDRSIEWIKEAVDGHDVFAWRIKNFPEFEALEGDPRYQALLRRMNFPEAQAQN